MSKKETRIKIGGIVVDTDLIESVIEVLLSYDRMPKNPDLDFLRSTVKDQLCSAGLLRLIVFVCPKFDTKSLSGPTPYKYMPTEATRDDLFEPRLPKIRELREALYKLGVVTTLEVIIGDNDFETYILPFLYNFKLDTAKMLSRQLQYADSFRLRAQKDFGSLVTVWSLADLGISTSTDNVTVSSQQYADELYFFTWLFSEEGPYKGQLTFSEEELRSMIGFKFRSYGAQGEFLESLGGILLQTEGPGVWLQRTEMLRCTGFLAVPAIYPWIRREEVKELQLR